MYDIIIIGSGPGGYAGAIRASQLGAKVAIVERAELGGVCLNWGCIPTKALLKSAQVFEYAKHAAAYGVDMESEPVANIAKMVERSRGVAAQMSKGIEFLMKKHNIEVLSGEGKIVGQGKVSVDGTEYEAKNVVIATGARPRYLPAIPVDGERVIDSRKALTLGELPKSMIVVGSGAIGLEFASFYATLGCKVTVVEYLPRIAPLEDAEISSTLERAMRKAKITVMTQTTVLGVENCGDVCKVKVNGKKGELELEAEVVLSAVGVCSNIENLGLEECGVEVERGKVVVDMTTYRTSVEGIYAIGDVIATPALAHVATAEAIRCIEQIMGHTAAAINYSAIPSCIYTTPEVSSVGMTEEEAKGKFEEVTVGKFSLMASGKATAAGARDGVIKLVFGGADKVLVGAHLVGLNVTEMVSGLTSMVCEGVTARTIVDTVHPHPTISEAIMEAAAGALGEAIHG